MAKTEISPCKKEDVAELLALPFNQGIGIDSSEILNGKIETPLTRTIRIDGEILFCGGVNEIWKDRGEAWAFFRPDRRQHFIALHHAVVDYFRSCPLKRVEATVECNFENGHRWIRALGFKLEAPRLTAFFPNGTDASLYALLKG